MENQNEEDVVLIPLPQLLELLTVSRETLMTRERFGLAEALLTKRLSVAIKNVDEGLARKSHEIKGALR